MGRFIVKGTNVQRKVLSGRGKEFPPNVTSISKVELHNAEYQGQVTRRCTQLSTTLAETEQHDEAQGANLSTRQR